MYHINRSYRLYPKLLQRTTVITSRTTADFLPREQETLFPLSQNWLCLNWRKYIPYSALCFKKTNRNKFRGVQQELRQFWKGTVNGEAFFFFKLKKANKNIYKI